MLRMLTLALTIAAAVTPQCGGSSTTSGAVQNVQLIVVNSGPANTYFNGAFTTVTICPPGQSSCQTIDGMLVGRSFGRAGATVVVEERLEGPEVSLMAVTGPKISFIGNLRR